MFEYTTTIRLYDTDIGGNIFFTNQLKYAHDAFEAFIESKGTNLSRLLKKSPCWFPVVHAESDYSSPCSLNDRITVKLRKLKTGTTSFTLAHVIHVNSSTIAGRGKITYVCVNKRGRKKMRLPAELIRLLKDLS